MLSLLLLVLFIMTTEILSPATVLLIILCPGYFRTMYSIVRYSLIYLYFSSFPPSLSFVCPYHISYKHSFLSSSTQCILYNNIEQIRSSIDLLSSHLILTNISQFPQSIAAGLHFSITCMVMILIFGFLAINTSTYLYCVTGHSLNPVSQIQFD